VRSRLEGSQRDRTVLSGLAGDAVLSRSPAGQQSGSPFRMSSRRLFARAEFCTTVVIGRQASCGIRREEAKVPV